MCAGLLPVTRLFSYTSYKYQFYRLSYLILVHCPDVMSLILCSIKYDLTRTIHLFIYLMFCSVLSLLILLLQSDNIPWTWSVQSNTLKLPVSHSEAEIIYSRGRDMGAIKKGVSPKIVYRS